MSTEEARKMIKKNPHLIDEIRNAIEHEARERSIVTKFCFTRMGNLSIREQDKNYQGRKFKIDHSKLRIEGLNDGRYRIEEDRTEGQITDQHNKEVRIEIIIETKKHMAFHHSSYKM